MLREMKTLLNIFIGLVLWLLTIIIHEELNELKRLELTSFLLVLIGSVYYGFALLTKHKKTMIIEIIVATMNKQIIDEFYRYIYG